MIRAGGIPVAGIRLLTATEHLLAEGGDARLALDANGANRYGCSPIPDAGLAALGSSTASGVSAAGFAAAERLRDRLERAVQSRSEAAVCADEFDRMRQEFLQLCGLDDMQGIELVFAASGTDAHLLAAQLAGESRLAIMVDAAESGSGVPSALAGHHFSDRTALGNAVVRDARIGPAASGVATVALRRADGSPRPGEEVDADFARIAEQAVASGRRVLLVLADVSKTGMIAPSPACAAMLRRTLSGAVDVLVDACQFRIAPPTLRAYLENGFMVALTGSKFLSGPPFSGALLIPGELAGRMAGRPLPRALAAYSSRTDWSGRWDAAALPDTANFSLVLRWEAALEELRAFSRISGESVVGFLQEFAGAVRSRLQNDPVFEALALPELERGLGLAPGWDGIQTIFPFLLRHPVSRRPLAREETARIYRLAQQDLSAHSKFNLGEIAAVRCQFGQPVACGTRDGVPMSALRICASARMAAEAAAHGGRGAVRKAMSALDKVALLVLSGAAGR